MELTVGVCEDDPALRRVVRQALERAGHEVVVAHTGAEAMRVFGDSDLDVVVMDIGLPDADGRDVCQALQASGQDAPVLFLTALDAMHHRLAGFNAGGDDYVTKPFDVKELMARIAVLGRRSRQTAPRPDGAVLELDAAAHTLRVADRETLLSPTEFRMLAAIAARPGEVVRRRAVIGAAWPDGAAVSDNTVDSLMRRLRSKLAEVDCPATIETVRGVGYRILHPELPG
ncbi:response regulator transcription factor [Nocardioides ginsengisoli]|uniref:Response regulator transcription factor n=1 Tax=Nocardioides ginsengisoli TaxID=363868 RepID=A0ABW3W3M2_9ACTN